MYQDTGLYIIFKYIRRHANILTVQMNIKENKTKAVFMNWQFIGIRLLFCHSFKGHENADYFACFVLLRTCMTYMRGTRGGQGSEPPGKLPVI